MAKMARGILIIACLLFALSPLVAAWTWDAHTGATQWKVDVTEDETGCGGGRTTESIVVTIKHSGAIAEMGNWGHGKVQGAFSGNKLSFLQRTIPDEAGHSTLYGFDAIFSPDCMGFSGEYRWNYVDPYMECSGSTKLKGSRLDGTGCPGAEEPIEEEPELITIVDDINGARAEQDSASKEKSYQAILQKDPKNFWANWDMAELKKKQGKYDQFFKYLDKAATNENVYADTREKLKEEAMKSLGLPLKPTPGTSPLLRLESVEANGWEGGMVNDVFVAKEAMGDQKTLSMKLRAIMDGGVYDYVNKIIGPPR